MSRIDGYRSQAESHPDYAGQDGPYWCGEDGVWHDIWLAKDPPFAAKVGVFRKGFAQPIYEVALWAEYGSTRDMWKKFPTVMIAKCAEARAIRKAFPERLGGTYIPEEIIETTGRVVEPTKSLSRASVSPVPTKTDRDAVKKSLWDLAHGTYDWDQETLDAVAFDHADKHLTDMDAAALKDLHILIASEGPEERAVRVDRALGIVEAKAS